MVVQAASGQRAGLNLFLSDRRRRHRFFAEVLGGASARFHGEFRIECGSSLSSFSFRQANVRHRKVCRLGDDWASDRRRNAARISGVSNAAFSAAGDGEQSCEGGQYDEQVHSVSPVWNCVKNRSQRGPVGAGQNANRISGAGRSSARFAVW